MAPEASWEMCFGVRTYWAADRSAVVVQDCLLQYNPESVPVSRWSRLPLQVPGRLEFCQISLSIWLYRCRPGL